MKTIKLKRQKTLILILIFFVSILFIPIDPIVKITNAKEKYKSPPSISPSGYLPKDEYIHAYDYADNYIDWSYNTYNPTQNIDAWAVESSEWSIFISGFNAGGYLLSTTSSDSGRFNVPHGDNWHIVFFNNQFGSGDTFITYSTSFVGDSRPPAIYLVYYGSASYRAGMTCEIEWSSVNAGNNVKIELFKGGLLDTTIISSTPNDGLYQWNIPLDIIPGSDYQLKVSCLSTSAEDTSENFEIRDPNIFTIMFPNYTCSLSMGNYYEIQFDNSEYVGEVNISLYHNDEFVYYIATKRNNWGMWYHGYCPWTIRMTLTPSKNYSIRICDYEDANTKGESDYFEITEHRGFNFINPLENANIIPNENYKIEWNSSGPVKYIQIDLYRDVYNDVYYRQTWQFTIVSNLLNNGSYLWKIPDLLKDDKYQIRISAMNDAGAYEFSEFFYIGPPITNDIPGYNILVFLGVFFIILGIQFILRKNGSNLKY